MTEGTTSSNSNTEQQHHEERVQDDNENNSSQQNSSQKEQLRNDKIAGGWMLAGSYFIGWLVILIVFKLVYNHYHSKTRASKKKWFTTHPEKEAYEKLIAGGEEDEEVLRKALLRRAMSDIRRVWELQEEKESLHKLMRAGAIPESMWNSYQDADRDMQLEIYDLQAEAETFKPGWSQTILKESAQLVQKERELTAMRSRLEMTAQARAADPALSAQEKQSEKKNLAKVQAIAEDLINKKYEKNSSKIREATNSDDDDDSDSDSEEEK